MGKSLYAVGSYKEYDMNNRFFNINLAGGALLDIGVYALSLMRSFMAETPDQVMSQVRFAPTGTDEQASIILMNKNNRWQLLRCPCIQSSQSVQ